MDQCLNIQATTKYQYLINKIENIIWKRNMIKVYLCCRSNQKHNHWKCFHASLFGFNQSLMFWKSLNFKLSFKRSNGRDGIMISLLKWCHLIWIVVWWFYNYRDIRDILDFFWYFVENVNTPSASKLVNKTETLHTWIRDLINLSLIGF